MPFPHVKYKLVDISEEKKYQTVECEAAIRRQRTEHIKVNVKLTSILLFQKDMLYTGVDTLLQI